MTLAQHKAIKPNYSSKQVAIKLNCFIQHKAAAFDLLYLLYKYQVVELDFSSQLKATEYNHLLQQKTTISDFSY